MMATSIETYSYFIFPLLFVLGCWCLLEGWSFYSDELFFLSSLPEQFVSVIPFLKPF